MEENFQNVLHISDSPKSQKKVEVRLNFSRFFEEQYVPNPDNNNISRLPFTSLVCGQRDRFGSLSDDINNKHVKTQNIPYQERNEHREQLNLSITRNRPLVIKPMEDELDKKIEEEFISPSTLPAANQPATCSEKSSPKAIFVISTEILARQKQAKTSNCEDFKPELNGDGRSKKKLQNYQNTKDKTCPDENKNYLSKTKMNSRFYKPFLLFLISVLSTMFFSVFLYEIQDRKHSNDFASAVVELKKEIYGQDEAIHALTNYLLLDTPSSRIIILAGGTGVGKSFTVDIIKKNFPRQYAIYQYFPPIEAVSKFRFSFLYPHLIILENLWQRDLKDVLNFLKEHQDTYKNRFVTVLAVFNFEHIDAEDNTLQVRTNLYPSLDAQNAFNEENIDVEIIPYDSLNDDALQKCIMNVMTENEILLYQMQIDYIKESLKRNNVGCKGAHSRVQVIGRTNYRPEENYMIYDID